MHSSDVSHSISASCAVLGGFGNGLACFLRKGLRMRRFALVSLCVLGLCAKIPVSGTPLLQLDIEDGSYDQESENIVSGSNPFTLYTLFNTTKGKASGTYYLSVAIVPKTLNPPANPFGSFKVNGTVYSVANGNIVFGNPPVSVTKNSSDLPGHGIFDTHYAEIGFTFNKNNKANLYNTEDNPGGLVQNSNGKLLYEDFTVDVSGLAAGYQVHFDLYNVTLDKRGNRKVGSFAPFSHDAQSIPPPPPPSVADTSSTMILLGMAMLVVEGMRRRLLR
jgi:hypothetical protein